MGIYDEIKNVGHNRFVGAERRGDAVEEGGAEEENILLVEGILGEIQGRLQDVLRDIAQREDLCRREVRRLVGRERKLRRLAQSMESMLRAADEEELVRVSLEALNRFLPHVRCRFSKAKADIPHVDLWNRDFGATEDSVVAGCEDTSPGACLALRLERPFVSPNRGTLRCQGAGDECKICIPVLVDGAVVGVFTLLLAEQKAEMNEEELGLLANYISMAFTRLRQINSLLTLSLTDPVTQLPNRRFAVLALEREIRRSERASGSFALAALDIDHFKQVNDRYGHAEGDRVLSLLGKVGKQVLRGGDLLARLGGDEFLVLLPEISEEAAKIALERFRESFGQAVHAAGVRDLAPGVALSVGLVTFPAHGRRAEDLLAAADRRLYQAKECGRDCLVATS